MVDGIFELYRQFTIVEYVRNDTDWTVYRGVCSAYHPGRILEIMVKFDQGKDDPWTAEQLEDYLRPFRPALEIETEPDTGIITINRCFKRWDGHERAKYDFRVKGLKKVPIRIIEMPLEKKWLFSF